MPVTKSKFRKLQAIHSVAKFRHLFGTVNDRLRFLRVWRCLHRQLMPSKFEFLRQISKNWCLNIIWIKKYPIDIVGYELWIIKCAKKICGLLRSWRTTYCPFLVINDRSLSTWDACGVFYKKFSIFNLSFQTPFTLVESNLGNTKVQVTARVQETKSWLHTWFMWHTFKMRIPLRYFYSLWICSIPMNSVIMNLQLHKSVARSCQFSFVV